jgi:hypothetical protein
MSEKPNAEIKTVQHSSSPANEDESIVERRIVRKLDLRLMPGMCFLSMISILDRTNIGYVTSFICRYHPKITGLRSDQKRQDRRPRYIAAPDWVQVQHGGDGLYLCISWLRRTSQHHGEENSALCPGSHDVHLGSLRSGPGFRHHLGRSRSLPIHDGYTGPVCQESDNVAC